MQAKREQVLVGLFVLVAVTVLFVTCIHHERRTAGKSTTKFQDLFPFAGGLEPGATVRSPEDPKWAASTACSWTVRPRRLDVSSAFNPTFLSKSTSSVKIMSMSRSETTLEIFPGSASPRAPRRVASLAQIQSTSTP